MWILRCAAIGVTPPGAFSAVALDFNPLFLRPLLKILSDCVSTIAEPATITPVATFGKAQWSCLWRRAQRNLKRDRGTVRGEVHDALLHTVPVLCDSYVLGSGGEIADRHRR